MRRFNLILNGSRLMMFPFYLSMLLCVALLMVKFGIKLFELCVNIVTLPFLDLLIGVLTLVDFVLVAQMLILVALCGYVQFIKSPQERASLGDNWLYHINFASLKLIVINSLVTIAGIEVLKAFLEEGTMNQTEMKWSVIVFLAFSTAALIYAVTERLAEHKSDTKEESH
ncbi:YqhA family protein [Aeromonas simiae]|uniref:YqhA family protein n=1 Tax=Aeromonas simiae TaxID=218936 RepID=UPI0005A9D505|nr:YqhA family protein [Aeromonas simiae]MDO2947869.1 YqhA family protein [Aeromonas simiae]MDO2950958.1 YqhA family protein [Aeromonas simiae]MDO2955235.1 YqhA family protein [Aeromonas simiae]